MQQQNHYVSGISASRPNVESPMAAADRRTSSATNVNRPVAIDLTSDHEEPTPADTRDSEHKAADITALPSVHDMMASFHELQQSKASTPEPHHVIDRVIEAEGERSLRVAIRNVPN